MTSQLLFFNAYFPLPAMVDFHRISPSPMATPLSKSYGISNKIFDEDHTQLLLSLGYIQFEGDLRKFKITCPNDPNTFVILNTHVDDGGAVLTWRSKLSKHSATATQVNSTLPPWTATSEWDSRTTPIRVR